MSSFYTEEELKNIGFRSYGKGVLLSRNTSIYGASNMVIGDYVRIDDFCILSGNLTIGNHVHIAAAVLLFAGKKGITIKDFAGISSRTAVYAESDDYSGNAMTNPTIPDTYRAVSGAGVVFEKHSLIGTGCTVLPGVHVGEGVSVGSMALVNKSLEPWGMYVGIPCRKIRDRSRKLLELEEEFMRNSSDSSQSF